MISSHLTSFAGAPVVPFDPGMALPEELPPVAWRLEIEDFDAEPEVFADLVAAFRHEVPAESVRALVIGEWGAAYESALPVGLLVEAATEWTDLRHLFLADLIGEQCEISWITHDDITGILRAYPQLETLWVRGGNELRMEPVRHEGLRELVIQTGGLPGHVSRAVAASDLPHLHRLDLWLGQSDYGGDTTPADLADLLAGDRVPALRHLAICNAENADDIARVVADAPVVAQLETLDLSKGVLTDTGGEALLAGRPLTHLSRLDLSHHFLSEECAARVVAALPTVEVDVTDPQEVHVYGDRQYRFTAVGE
ncbi:STM4015 family protein [Micromonospora sp. NPDC000207]|uniref:STM4015 family protein n=1 Tax=Micromonospora sp. NPDC000207 TaxID=3154246 RepID=UPI00331DF004